MSARSGMLVTLALGALVSLSGLIAQGRPWGAGDAALPSGPTLVPALMLGLVAAVLATRGRGRVIVGAIVAVLLLALGLDAVRVLVDVSPPRDPLAVAAVLTMAVGGPATAVAVAWFGRSWPGLGQRYERTRTSRDDGSTLQMWRDLDAGVDPTER